MRESKIENYLREEVERLGGIAFKFTSPNRRSVPDRICVFPEGVLVFVEVKATGKRPTDAQVRERRRLQALSQLVVTVASKFQVSTLIQTIEQLIDTQRRIDE